MSELEQVLREAEAKVQQLQAELTARWAPSVRSRRLIRHSAGSRTRMRESSVRLKRSRGSWTAQDSRFGANSRSRPRMTSRKTTDATRYGPHRDTGSAARRTRVLPEVPARGRPAEDEAPRTRVGWPRAATRGVLPRRTAEALHAHLVRARAGELPEQEARSGRTFGDACDEWLRDVEHVRERQPSTVADYRNVVHGRLLGEFGQDTPIEKVGTDRQVA